MKQNPISRRCFVKRTAGVAAGIIGFPYLIRSSALGLSGTVAPSNRLQMAQIGCGSMGNGNLNSFLNMTSDVQVIAVCDVDLDHANGKKNNVDAKYGNKDCRVYQDYRQLLDKEKLDIVSHAVPDHWHAAIAVACCRQGIDVYGEKPLARTVAEGRAICQAVKRYSIVWQTGSWQRSVGHFRQAAELVCNGRIGKVNYAEVGLPDGNPQGPEVELRSVPATLDYEMWLGSAPWRPYQRFGGQGVHWDWRWIMDYSGGQLTDWAGHNVDITHWGLGMDYMGPVEIEGKGDYPKQGIYNTPYAYDFMCTYANGVKIRVANASKLKHGRGATWYGDNGWIHVNRGGLKASDPAIVQEKIGVREIQLYKSDSHHQNFIDCVKSRKETITPAEIAHRSVSVGFLGEIAMLTGRKLKWDPANEQFLGDETANRYLTRSYRSPWHL